MIHRLRFQIRAHERLGDLRRASRNPRGTRARTRSSTRLHRRRVGTATQTDPTGGGRGCEGGVDYIDVEWALLLRHILLEEEEVREGDVEGKPFLAMFYPSLKLDCSRALLIQYLMDLNLTKTTEYF